MPIYEYCCSSCGHDFEFLVRHDTEPACPACGASEIERKLSITSIKSSGSHAIAMRAAKKRDVAQGKEQASAQREYERNHED